MHNYQRLYFYEDHECIFACLYQYDFGVVERMLVVFETVP